MDAETNGLRRTLERYRLILRATTDERASAALGSLIEETKARLRALEGDEARPDYRFD